MIWGQDCLLCSKLKIWLFFFAESILYLFQKMDKSLYRLLNNENYGKLMDYAKKKSKWKMK